MLTKKLLAAAVLLLAGAAAIAAEENAGAPRTTTLSGPHARMTIVTEAPRSFTRSPADDAGLVTIFSSLAVKYPKGEYWCCEGYNIQGPSLGEQWIGAAFTPAADHTATRIEVAAGWSQGANGVVISLHSDRGGVPGRMLEKWNVSNLPTFGTCCTLLVKSDRAGIPLSGGKQYWIVLSTNDNQLDTVDSWNVNDTDQVDPQTLASNGLGHWTAFQTTPGLAFAVKGSN